MAQALSFWPLTDEYRVRNQISQCGICVRQSGAGTDFCDSTSVLPCHYHSANVPYPFIHLPPTLCNVYLPVLLSPLSLSFRQCSIPIHSPTTPRYKMFFSQYFCFPVSTIPQLLHSHSLTYHPRYIMFLSQYFCSPLPVSFHQAPHSSSSTCCCCQKEKRTKPEDLTEMQCCLANRGALGIKILLLLFA